MLGGAIAIAFLSASTDKSQLASSGTSSTRRPRQRALMRYITNDGVVVSTVATSALPSGLTNAVSSRLMTSSLPTPGNTSAAVTSRLSAMAWRRLLSVGSG